MIPSPSIDDLARQLGARNGPHRNGGRGPFILFLGEGCARAAGAPSRVEAARQALAMLGPDRAVAASASDDEVFRQYDDATRSLSPEQIARMLRAAFSRIAVPAFYVDLAAMVRERYFPLIITMNFDTLLDQALSRSGIKSSEIRTTTFAAGKRTGADMTSGVEPLTHIVKLHGDLGQGTVQISPDEIDAAVSDSRQWIKADLAGDLIMVAHGSGDALIDRWLTHASHRTLWWVDADPPADPALVRSWSSTSAEVVGEIGRPRTFFTQLALRLRLFPPTDQGLESVSFDDVEVPIAESLHNEILRGQSSLFNLEQQASAEARPPAIQAQIAYQKRQISRLEDRIWLLPEVKPKILDCVKTIGDRIRSNRSEISEGVEVGQLLDFVDGQVLTLDMELQKATPNTFLISASLSATLGLADRLLAQYGQRVVDAKDVRALAEFVPTAASKVVL